MLPHVFPPRLGLVVLSLLGLAKLCAQVTESPQTVAPGKLLVEMDGVTLGIDRDRVDGGKLTALGLANTVVSAGISETVDVQVGATLLVRRSFSIGESDQTQTGLGDLVIRAKWKFWNDDQLGAALAVLPYVKVPANTGGVGNHAFEGGIILPWEMRLPGGATAGAMGQWDILRNDAGNGYDSRWAATGFVQQPLFAGLSVYGEAMLAVESAGWSRRTGAVGAGALWQLTKVVQLDYELLRGLNRQAADWTHTFRVNWAW